MVSIEIKKQDALKLEDEYKIGEVVECSDSTKFELVELDDWTQDDKYQYRDMIFLNKNNGKYYSLSSGRSGSHFTDWYYESEDWDDEVELIEVEKKEITTHVWLGVK